MRRTLLFLFSAWVISLSAVAQPGPQFQAQLLRYDVKYYWLKLHIENTSSYVEGSSAIGAVVTAPSLDTFGFQLGQELTLDSVVVNGRRYLTVTASPDQRKVGLKSPLTKGAFITALVYYHGTPLPSSNTWDVGLVNAKDPFQNGITYSMSVPYSASAWFPCKQVMPDLADSVILDITADSSLKVAANGLLENVTDAGNGKKTWHWRSRYPINYYLISVSVGRYAEIKGSVTFPGVARPMLLHNMVYDDSATIAKGKTLLTATSAAFLRYYSQLFGTYPFANEKFGIYTIPLSGGMEHQTMPGLGSIDFYLLAHEMSHQWFGDHVSLATFRDMWLNEGWASYCEYLTAAHFRPGEEKTIMGNYHQDVMGIAGGIGYVSDTIKFDNLYQSRLVYHKGASVIHTLRHVINNDSVFFSAVRDYVSRYGSRNVTMKDFISVMENWSGLDLKQFFAQWYYGEGYPIYTVTWYQKDGMLHLKLVQTTSSTTKLFKTPVEIALKTAAGESRIRVQQDTNTQWYFIPFTETINSIAIDPDDWLLNKLKSITKDSTLLSVLGTEDQGEGMRVYPNPFHEKLCVRMPCFQNGTQVNLTNEAGRTLKTLSPGEAFFSLDTGSLAAGVYFLSVRQKDTWFVQKIVKK